MGSNRHGHSRTLISMKSILIWLLVAAILAIGIVAYRSQTTGSRLKVEPHAAEEIEKAKQR